MKFLLAMFLAMPAVSNAKSITITTKNVCSIISEVNYESMREAKNCLAELDSIRGNRKYSIYLYLDSPGGSVYDGLQFIQFAKNIKNLHTVTNFAASMAAAIVQHLPGKRYVAEYGISMFHRARGGVQGQFGEGELESRLALWKKIVANFEKVQADRIGISLKEYKQRRLNEWWLFGEDNIKFNVSDEAVKMKCSALLRTKTKVVIVQSLFGSYEETIYQCPMLN